jgi:hypothetical protein
LSFIFHSCVVYLLSRRVLLEGRQKNCEAPPPKFVVVFDVNAEHHIMAGFAEVLKKFEAYKKKFPNGQVRTLNGAIISA